MKNTRINWDSYSKYFGYIKVLQGCYVLPVYTYYLRIQKRWWISTESLLDLGNRRSQAECVRPIKKRPTNKGKCRSSNLLLYNYFFFLLDAGVGATTHRIPRLTNVFRCTNHLRKMNLNKKEKNHGDYETVSNTLKIV